MNKNVCLHRIQVPGNCCFKALCKCHQNLPVTEECPDEHEEQEESSASDDKADDEWNTGLGIGI